MKFQNGNKAALKHGMRNTSTYTSWLAMKSRCYNKNHKSYPLYGGRNIKVADYWLHDFLAFVSDLGERPDGTTLDRINPNGNYERGNIRWATRKEQAEGRRDTHWLTYQGETLTIEAWGKRLGINSETIRSRLMRGFSIEEALSMPVQKKLKKAA